LGSRSSGFSGWPWGPEIEAWPPGPSLVPGVIAAALAEVAGLCRSSEPRLVELEYLGLEEALGFGVVEPSSSEYGGRALGDDRD